MKMVPLREVKQQLSEYVGQSQREKILITKYGRPAALIWGVEGNDIEDVLTMTDPSFWRMIRKRRLQKAVPLGRVKRRN